MTLPTSLAHRFRAAFLWVAVLVVFVSTTGVAYAGFGITPPYVNNQRLTRGSVYEQRITIVRSDPTEDLKATLTLNIPGAEDWFAIDQGKEFILPKGLTQVPIVVTVKVPEDAPFKEFKGAIRIRTESAAPPTASTTGVSIALGAQIDVDVTVVDKIYDFEVRRIRLADLEEGRTRWGLFFPGKIRFYMTIENTGNTEYGPSRVHFDIYDSEMETKLESVDNTNDIEQLAPFATKEVVAELPTRLPAGRYEAKYAIYKGDAVAQQNTLTLSVNQVGTVAGYEGYGFDGLSLTDKLKVAGVVGVPVLLLLILIIILISKRRARRAYRTYAGSR